MALAASFPDIKRIFIGINSPLSSSNLQLPLLLLNVFFRRALLATVNFVSSIANTVAILVCYFYLKTFRRHSMIIVDGYITIFKTFAEFISATMCLCYGLMEVDFFYTAVGLLGIIMGLILKAVLLYGDHHKLNDAMRALVYCFCGLYIMCVLTCSFAFHSVAMAVGVLPCVTRVMTCVVPLVALSEFFRISGPHGEYFSYLADLVAVSMLWWFCAHLSFKYFIVVPSVIGLVFSFIQYAMTEIQKATAKPIGMQIFQAE